MERGRERGFCARRDKGRYLFTPSVPQSLSGTQIALGRTILSETYDKRHTLYADPFQKGREV